MISVFGSITICLLASCTIVIAGGTYYEDISGNEGNTYIEGSIQLMPVINKSFYKCSISEYCKYVIKNLTNGHFSLHNNTADLPHNRTGLHIWKKINHGNTKAKVPQGPFYNCQEAYTKGYKTTGVVRIYVPDSLDFFNVRCDMVTDGGGWIVFQRRVDASVDFYRGWQEYKNGFGDLNGNFWLGLEKLHKLASPGKGAMLRVDMKHFRNPDSVKYAEYRLFEIMDEAAGYRLNVGGYSGDAGDSLLYHVRSMFTTKDRDQDSYPVNCAVPCAGAWWYYKCYLANLNGLYRVNGQNDIKYMSWFPLFNSYGGIIFSEMKLRYPFP